MYLPSPIDALLRHRCLRMIPASIGLLVTVSVSAVPGRADDTQSAFAVREGDRVLFYGDSITEQNLYNTFVETFIITRFPKLKVDFEHAGWGGDSVNGGHGGAIDERLERDVFPYKPTVVTIMLGMNDGHYHPFSRETFDIYVKGYRHILDRLQTTLPQARVFLIEPSAYDDVTREPLFPGGYNAVLLRFSAADRDLATEYHHGIVDFNTPVVAALEGARKLDPAVAAKLISDRIHPGAAGHLIMAKALLEAWHAPKLVSAVSIDAGLTQVSTVENATISDLVGGESISWKELDAVLPFPINPHDALLTFADKIGSVTESLNLETLKVSGLRPGNYELSIDAQKVGQYNAGQLAAGVNLAPLDTPMYRQADKVYQLSLQHNRMHFVNWRSVQLGVGEIKTKPVTDLIHQLSDELISEEAELVKQQHQLAQPIVHNYQLVKLSS